ncbi:hypothetical protein FB45DRAFT_113729 [Roridomyces roridus]|uniref:Uncharacterized protein n=1 Tax=Roridomyces roridus TaxID=1738132 RepID=A0AAD7BKG4_9AGAR|nr:hypothetical protein FB45DRAFT_113729 [Roridomyces roridus]
MPAPLPVTVDDASPLISYDPPTLWFQETLDDAFLGSSSLTKYSGASLTLRFEGNWVNVTGWKGPWHGNYTVTLDQSTYSLSGRTTTNHLIRTTLFSSGTIGEGNHTLQIVNEEWDNLQIDSISYACLLSGSNSTNAPLQTTKFEDTDGSFSYYPKGVWDVGPPNPENPKDHAGHSISMPNAYVNFTFSVGDAVSIYGTTGPGHSTYSVSRSDQPAQQFTANRERNSSDVLLYIGTNFGPGNHTISLVSQDSGLFQISYAEVHSAVEEFATSCVNFSASRFPAQHH